MENFQDIEQTRKHAALTFENTQLGILFLQRPSHFFIAFERHIGVFELTQTGLLEFFGKNGGGIERNLPICDLIFDNRIPNWSHSHSQQRQEKNKTN